MGRPYVLISNKEQSYFEIEKIPLNILDNWMIKKTKAIGMEIFQTQQFKKRWKYMKDSIKKVVWKYTVNYKTMELVENA